MHLVFPAPGAGAGLGSTESDTRLQPKPSACFWLMLQLTQSDVVLTVHNIGVENLPQNSRWVIWPRWSAQWVQAMHKICCSARQNYLITDFSLILVSRRLESFPMTTRHAKVVTARSLSVAVIRRAPTAASHVPDIGRSR